MSAIHVAQASRGDRVKAINRSIAGLEMQAEQGRFAQPGSYLHNHSSWCREEIERQRAEINRLGSLSDDDLIAEFVPEVARDKAIAKDIERNGPVEFDPMGRGAMPPRQVVVSKTPPPVRREGGEVAADHRTLIGANGAPLPPNVVYGYDENFNLVPLNSA